MEITGSIALVLGGARGIGRALGMALARAGATVVLTWYDWPEESVAMQEELAAMAGDHLAVQVDLREPQQVRRLVERIEKKYGRLDILVNNIERGGMPVVHGAYGRPVNQGQWELELATTLGAKYLVFQEALPLLKKSPEAAVVVLSSIAALVGRSGPAGLLFADGYAAANRAVSSLVETWARQGAPTVRVNEIMLGIFETRHGEGTKGWGLLTAEERRAVLDHTLLGRTGKLDDVVRTVLFLVENAPFMTGAQLRLDGGYVLGGEKIPPMPDGVL